MVEAYVLLDTYPGQTDQVMRELEEFPQITAKRRVHDGNVGVAVRLRASTHDEIAHFMATTLRFLAGVRTVEEVQDADEYPGAVRRALSELTVP